MKAIDSLKFNAEGLIPAIAQDADSGEVLMLAYMNAESLERTVESGRATYWSRSRNSFWLKGETSGHFQEIVSISTDCDKDTILLKVRQVGAACHENYRSCFYRDLESGDWRYNGTPLLSE